MKSFDEALSVLMMDRDGPSAVQVHNMEDITQTILSSDKGKQFLRVITTILTKRPAKGYSKKDLKLSLALTCFASGIRVGQEMEKQEFKR